jgi:hypothetical protein
MAKKRRAIDLDKLRTTSKVRYGRANLTIEQWVSVHGTRVERALKAHRAGEASAEDVAWAFVRDQVTAHTPSFNWDEAGLDQLLPRIIAVAKVPKLKSKSADELVLELEEIGTKEEERWRKLNETIRISILPTIPNIRPTISEDLLKMYGQLPKLPVTSPALSDALRTNKQISEAIKGMGLNRNYDTLLKAVRPDLKIMESVRTDLEAISKMVQPQVPDFGIDLSRFQHLAGFGPGSEWQKLMEQVAEAARGADSPEVADAVEATADETAVEPFEIDLAPVIERVKELLDQLKNLAPEDSMARALLISIAADLIVRFIEHAITGK